MTHLRIECDRRLPLAAEPPGEPAVERGLTVEELLLTLDGWPVTLRPLFTAMMETVAPTPGRAKGRGY